MQYNLKCLFGTALLLCTASMANAQMPTYTIQDLGTLGGNRSDAYSINNQGQVTGGAFTADGRYRAFLYSNGVMKDLGTLVNTDPQDDIGTGNAINSSGQVVGIFPASPGYGGFLYSNGTLQALPLATAQGINNQGLIVGQSNAVHAASYLNGTVTDLGVFGTGIGSIAQSVNNLGQIVGSSDTDRTGQAKHAFLYQNGVMQDLGVLSGKTESEALGINDSGMVVGVSYTGGGLSDTAVYWQNGQIHSLGTLGGPTSIAFGINKYGVIVGTADIPGNDSRPFVYQNGQMSDIFAGTGWSDGIAHGINDNGQIIGFGLSPTGSLHAFLAMPRVANTPAPGSLLVAVVGGGLLAGRLRRRSR